MDKVEWAKNLGKLTKGKENLPEGEGWFLVKEFREKSNIGFNRAYDLVSQGLEDGTLEKYNGSKYNVAKGMLTRKTWYRFVSDK